MTVHTSRGWNGGHAQPQSHPWRRGWKREQRLKARVEDLKAAHARVRKAKKETER